jgi:NADH-quinone oxidoreductase E subunit
MTTTTTTTTIDEVLAAHPQAGRDKLIPLLQEVQETFGFLSEEAVVKIGRHLDLPASKIYGVATFYNQFRFQPKGRFHVMCCRGTACHVKGSAKVLEQLERLLKLKAGQTSRDGLFSLEEVACLGACGLAPVVCINGEFHAKVTPKRMDQLIAECRNQQPETAR